MVALQRTLIGYLVSGRLKENFRVLLTISLQENWEAVLGAFERSGLTVFLTSESS